MIPTHTDISNDVVTWLDRGVLRSDDDADAVVVDSENDEIQRV